MKPYKVFVFWLLTVILGSIFLGVLDFLFFQDPPRYSDFFDKVFSVAYFAVIFSCVYSLPSLAILFLINKLYNKAKGFGKKQVLISMLCLSIAQFGIMLIFYSSPGQVKLYIVSFLSYTPIGLFLWWREFSRIESKSS